MSHRSIVMVKRSYLHIAVITLVCATLWLIITIYQALMAPGVVNIDQEVLTPINPKIEEEALKLLIVKENVAAIPFAPPAQEVVSVNEVSAVELPIDVIDDQSASVGGEEL